MGHDTRLLDRCDFPPSGAEVNLAVSGGPDSVGLLLLALDAALTITVHHVNHHLREVSTDDANFVRHLCDELDVACTVYDVSVTAISNIEAAARAERRRVLPHGVLTGHTMDDLAETVLLNMLRGAGVDGLSPMVNNPTKPLRQVRRAALLDYVNAKNVRYLHDESNDDPSFMRNRIRHDVIPLLNVVAERDVVPLLARQAELLFDDRSWLDGFAASDAPRGLAEIDCRELMTWERARLTRWLRGHLAMNDEFGERHPPSAAEIDRVIDVIVGSRVATELSGGRRLARRKQRLNIEDDSTTLTSHG